MNSKNDSRYPASPPVVLQRPYGTERRRTPSPGPSSSEAYLSYDRYMPARGNGFYREPFPNSYRPDPWHAERQYAGNSPSPDRYRPPRPVEGESWGRSTWRPVEQPPWPDRRTVAEAYDPTWGRQRRDTMAQPMFEPSDNWKQSHGSGSDSQDGDARDWSYDRYSGQPPRDPRDRSPERIPPRESFTPSYAQGERSRRFSGPLEQRELHPYGPRSDSYRPQYEERGQWGASSYHPGGTEVRNRDQRPPQRDMRLTPRPESFGERIRFSRERSVSGGSVQNSPLPSPIRTRTNLPDRVQFGHSRSGSGSGSYPHSPVSKSTPRPSWDFEPSPQHRLSPPRSRSRSMSQEVSHPPSRQSDLPYGEVSSPWTNRRATRSPSPALDSKLAPLNSRSPSHSSSRVEQHGDILQYPSTTPSRSVTGIEQPNRANIEGAADSRSISISPPSRLTHQGCADDNPPVSEPIPAHNDLTVSTSSHSLLDSHKESSRDVGGASPSHPPLSPMPPNLHDESSPEPDIPLAALAKHATSRTSASEPSTPMPDQSEPPSRDELPPRPQNWLAPNIQPSAEPMPLHEVLRAIVMVRLQRDHQTQEERVTPVLHDNLSKVKPPSMPSVTTPEDVIREVTTGARKKALEMSYGDTRSPLRRRICEQQTDLAAKVTRLRNEYRELHRQWSVHCGKLDDVAKAAALMEAAATAGRTTRRSLATMGDAVRSDLEMEQIIASLGNEEMTDANHLGAKNAAVIPDMISVTKGEIDHLYDDTNNEVENPAEYYAPKTGIDDWSEEEVNIFLDKFGEFPKQFGIIADFLPNKTPSQCVTFYYLHKNKHIDFRQVVARRVTKRKRGGRKQKSNALLADIRKRDDEVSAAGPGRRRRAAAPQFLSVEPRKGSARRTVATVQAELTPNGTPTPEPDVEPRKRRRRITARATATEQDDGAEEMDADAKPKRTRKPRRQVASTPSGSTPMSITPLQTPLLHGITETDPMEDVMSSSKFADQAGPSMQRKQSGSGGGWSEEDRGLFLQLLAQHGDDFKRISASMPNKTTVQVGAFYRAHADEMGLQRIVANAPKRSPTPETRQGIWKHATFTGPGVSFQKARAPPAGNYQLSANRLNIDPQFMKGYIFSSSQDLSGNGSGSSTPTSGLPGSSMGALRFHPSPYETMQVPYGFHHSHPMGSEDVSQAGVSSMHTHHIGHIANPSPFATGPLTTRFSSFPYRNFSPSHFTDNPSPSFSAVSMQSSYAQNARAHESEPLIGKTNMSSMSNSSMAFDYR